MGQSRSKCLHALGQCHETTRDLILIIEYVATHMAKELILRTQQQQSSENEALDRDTHSIKTKE